MISKNLYFNIVFYVVLISATAAGAAYAYFEKESLALCILLLVGIAIECSLLIGYLNKTNRRLAYFVESVKNSDTSVVFPKDIKSKPVHDLYNGLNHLNRLIQKIKMESNYNENLFRTLIEYSSTGFITMDRNGNFEVMNNYARKFLNVEHTSNLKRLSHSNPGLFSIIQHLKPGETKVYKLHQQDQVFDLSISLSEIKYFDQQFKIISLQDISKELDENELQAWHKLFRVITHEIMNSIAPITSLSQTLIGFYEAGGQIVPCDQINNKTISDTIKGLKVISEMSRGLMGFVEAYRKLNKVPAPDLKNVDATSWLSGFKTLAEEQVKNAGAKITIRLAHNCKTIKIDQQLMNQVLLNLLINSLDALQNVNEKSIELHVHKDDLNRTIIAFTDNGKGISEEDLERVFVPFFSTKENGNGIGLSLSKQIIKNHGGSISVQSKPNQGTTFTIYLTSK
jgi:two-component system, NtrC family, nitrogen regulation sensor histidine kinase NtrY